MIFLLFCVYLVATWCFERINFGIFPSDGQGDEQMGLDSQVRPANIMRK